MRATRRPTFPAVSQGMESDQTGVKPEQWMRPLERFSPLGGRRALRREKKDRPARTSARADPFNLSLTNKEFVVLVPLVVEGQSIGFPKPVQQ